MRQVRAAGPVPLFGSYVRLRRDRRSARGAGMGDIDPDAHREHFRARVAPRQSGLRQVAGAEDTGDENALGVDLDVVDSVEHRPGREQQRTSPPGAGY